MLRKTSNFLHASLLVLRKPPREKSLRDNSCSAAEFHHYSAGTGPLPVPPASHRKTVTTTRSSPARLSHWHPSAPTVPAHRKVPKCKHSHRSQTSQRASVRAVAHGHVFDLSVSGHAIHPLNRLSLKMWFSDCPSPIIMLPTRRRRALMLFSTILPLKPETLYQAVPIERPSLSVRFKK